MIEEKQRIDDNLKAKFDEQIITINEKTEEIEDLKSKLRQYEGNIKYIITSNLKYLLLLDEEILELNETQEGGELSYEGVKVTVYMCVSTLTICCLFLS